MFPKQTDEFQHFSRVIVRCEHFLWILKYVHVNLIFFFWIIYELKITKKTNYTDKKNVNFVYHIKILFDVYTDTNVAYVLVFVII